jgi:hypothetical protein
MIILCPHASHSTDNNKAFIINIYLLIYSIKLMPQPHTRGHMALLNKPWPVPIGSMVRSVRAIEESVGVGDALVTALLHGPHVGFY